jgi:hypothetical protein
VREVRTGRRQWRTAGLGGGCACAWEMEERALNRCGVSCKGGNAVVQSSTGPQHGKYDKVGWRRAAEP